MIWLFGAAIPIIIVRFGYPKGPVEEGRILLDGQLPDRSPVAQASREAVLVRNALSAAGWKGDVTPVLTFASDTFATHRANIKGTIVMNASELKESFASDRVVIPPADKYGINPKDKASLKKAQLKSMEYLKGK